RPIRAPDREAAAPDVLRLRRVCFGRAECVMSVGKTPEVNSSGTFATAIARSPPPLHFRHRHCTLATATACSNPSRGTGAGAADRFDLSLDILLSTQV